MKKTSAVLLIFSLILALLPTIIVFAEAVPVTVVADEGWGNATYDEVTKELKNIDGGYSFSMTTSGTNATLSKYDLTNGVTASKVVIPYQITYNDVTYTVTAQGAYMLCNSANTTNTTVTELIISEGITTLSATAFRSLKATTVLETVKLPSTLRTIGGNCFMGCIAIKSLSIPQGVTTIDGGALQGTGLISIELPSSITSFGGDMFYSCNKLQSVVFHFPLTSISGYFFRGCSALTSFDIPDTVTGSISALSFSGTGITEAVIPVGVTSIANSAFSGCSKLTSVTVKGDLTSVGNNVFDNCALLNDVNFEGEVSSIGTLTFQNAKVLQSITFESSTAPTLSADVFKVTGSNTPSTFTIYYPAEGDNAANYGEGSDFRNKIAATTVPAGKTLNVTYQPVSSSVATSSEITSVTPVDGVGYTVNYNITLGTGIANSKNTIALYNGTDLVDVKSVDSNETSVEFTTDEVITKAKIFVWDNMLNIKPLCAFQERFVS